MTVSCRSKEERIRILAQQIRPVGRCDDGSLCYYAECPFDSDTPFYRVPLAEEAGGLYETVRLNMRFVAGTIMGAYQFMPTAEEVYEQIPEKYFQDIVAFEVITPKFTDLEHDPHFSEGDTKYHTATVVLYAADK